MAKEKLYLILDCETTTLPSIHEALKNNTDLTDKQKDEKRMSKPLIYDIGWKVINKKGKVFSEHSYLVTETFSVPAIFNTAYYAEKRPLYIQKLTKGDIKLLDWNTIAGKLVDDLQKSSYVAAYNANFDFKRAIPYTERYIKALYSNFYQKWESGQVWSLTAPKSNTKYKTDKENFIFRNKKYQMIDIWAIACTHLINTKKYKQWTLDNEKFSASGKYFPTNAEAVFGYLQSNPRYIEEHTALEDVHIETKILLKFFKMKKKMPLGIIYSPFRILGAVTDYLKEVPQ